MYHAERDDESGMIAVGESSEREREEVGKVGDDQERHDSDSGEGEFGCGCGCLQVKHTQNGVDERECDGHRS